MVEDCVNRVGVDLNTASPSLLAHVAGINMGIARNIVAYREENGVFKERKELKKVAKLGEKTYRSVRRIHAHLAMARIRWTARRYIRNRTRLRKQCSRSWAFRQGSSWDAEAVWPILDEQHMAGHYGETAKRGTSLRHEPRVLAALAQLSAQDKKSQSET